MRAPRLPTRAGSTAPSAPCCYGSPMVLVLPQAWARWGCGDPEGWVDPQRVCYSAAHRLFCLKGSSGRLPECGETGRWNRGAACPQSSSSSPYEEACTQSRGEYALFGTRMLGATLRGGVERPDAGRRVAAALAPPPPQSRPTSSQIVPPHANDHREMPYRHRDRLRYESNPEAQREKSRRYYEENREKIIARVTAQARKRRRERNS